MLPGALAKSMRHPGLRWNTLLFLLLAAGLLWTRNIPAGLKELKDESYLFAFALLFAIRVLGEGAVRTIRKSLVAGSMVAITVCLSIAAVRFLSSGAPDEFFYTSFSFLLHPTYFGLLLLAAALVIIDDLRRIPSDERARSGYLQLSFCLIGIGLLCSKIIYLVYLAVIVAGFIIGMLRRNLEIFKDRRLQFIGAGSLLFFVAVNTYFNRTEQVIKAISENKAERPVAASGEMVDSSGYNSTTVRIAQWKYGMELVKRQPFYGTGTGDEVDDLRIIFREHNDPYALKHFGHAHSHYLHYLVMLGWPGLILAVLALLVPFVIAWRTGNHVATLFYCMLVPIGLTDILSHATIGACYGFLTCFFFTDIRK
ncbi:MAG: hypothetical protein RL021_1294 [Bacteroidota bacterium]